MEEVLQKLLGLLDRLVEERGVPQQDTIVDKNIVKTANSTLDNGKKPKANLTSNDKKRLSDTFNLFNKMFFDYKKKQEPDVAEKTKVSGLAVKQATPQAPSGTSKKSSIGLMGGGLLLLLGGLAALVTGLMNNGPFKGILKLLAKGGIKGGIAILKKAVKPFLEIIGKILKFPLELIGKTFKFLGKGLSKVWKFIGEGVGKIGSKVLGKLGFKLGGGGFMKMIGKFLGGFAKVFKKLPIVGTLISLGFAYSRFASGDVVGGTIDVLSGLAAMIPVVGTGVSIGLDVLNAVLDSKADNGPGKPKTSKIDILKDMVAPIGNWIWEHRQYIPILSAVDRFVMAYDDFKSGNIVDGLGNFAMALLNIAPGGLGDKMAEGFSAFMGLFEPQTGDTKTVTPSKSFMTEMLDSIGKALEGIWQWIKQTIKDGLMNLIPGKEKVMEFAGDAANATKEVTGYVSDKAKAALEGTKGFLGNVWKSVSGSTERVKNDIIASAKETLTDVKKATSNFVSSAKDMAKGTVDKKDTPTEKSTPLDPLSIMQKSMSDMQSISAKKFFGGQESKDGEVSSEKTDIGDILVKNKEKDNSVALMSLKLQKHANQLLQVIANNTGKQLSNVQNVTNSTTVMNHGKDAGNRTMVNVPNNRGGYGSSSYAIG